MSRQWSQDFTVVLDNIRSCYNVGSIFRTADALGVKHIFLCGITPGPPDAKIVKVSLGAEKFIPFSQEKQTWRVINWLRNHNYNIVALEQNKIATNLFRYQPKFPLALVLGTETKGLSEPLLKRCDSIVEIPMLGKKESLNVSVAFGVAGYYLRYCNLWK